MAWHSVDDFIKNELRNMNVNLTVDIHGNDSYIAIQAPKENLRVIGYVYALRTRTA